MGNTQYEKNLRAVATACKNYVDETKEQILWKVGQYNITTQDDNTIAYQKVVPTGATRVKIKSIGGMSYKSNNILPTDKISSNVSFSNDIMSITNSIGGMNILDSISLPAGTYVFSFILKTSGLEQTHSFTGYKNTTDTPFTVFSNLNTYNVGEVHTATLVLTETTNVFIKQWQTGSESYSFQLWINKDTAKDYNTYFENIRDSIVTSIKSYGANLADTSLFELGAINTNTGADIVNNERMRSNYIEVKPNTQYTLKWDNTNVNIICYDSDKVKTGNSLVAGTFTTTATTKYVRFYSGLVNERTQIMLNLGSTALPYKPYRGLIGSITIPDEVKALDGYGRGINENCYNVLDLETNEFTDKDGIVDLGTLNYQKLNNRILSSNLATIIKKPTNSTIANALTTKYTTTSYNNVYNHSSDKIIGVQDNGNLGIYDTEYYDNFNEQTFKTAMSGVPLRYERANYNTTDNLALPNNVIEVEAGGYLVFENQYQQAVPSNITYRIEVAK